MPVPRQVQRQIEEGNKAREEFIAAAAQREEEARDPLTPEPSSPPVEEPPTDEPVRQELLDKPQDDWEHKFRSMQGKYNAEVPNLSRQLKDLTEVANRQLLVIADLQAKAAAVPPAKEVLEPEPEPSARRRVTEEELDQYGRPFADFLQRMIDDEADRRLAKVLPRVDDMDSRLKVVDSRSQEQVARDFYAALDRMIPPSDAFPRGWRDVDDSPEFSGWLMQPDVYSGELRKNLLVRACEAADSNRAARFFLGYLAEQDAVNPRPSAPSPASSNGGGDAGNRVRLESLAGPGRPRQPATREAQAPETITEAQIKSFYTDVGKGKYRTRPDDKQKIVARIEAALLNNQIETAN